ncbi:MAG: UbiA family prenyltransferase [Gammaproteobacteria bacterium]|nr:UbiA family prenyltransferase [Gammaproteobacteria bacterium]
MIFLFHGSFFVSAAAASLAASSFLFFNLEVDFLLLLFVFSATLFSYNFARCFSFLSLFDSSSEPLAWYLENKTVLLLTIFLSGGLSTLLVFQFELKEWLFLGHVAVIVLLYSWPIRGRCLRMVPCLKIVLIAYCWATVCVGLVLLHSGVELFSDVAYVYLFLDRFLFIVAITLAFDVRDMACDRKDGLMTLPLVLGERGAKWLSLFLLLLVVCLAFQYLHSSLQFVFDLGVLLLAAILVVFSTGTHHYYYYLGLIDGLIFFRAMSVML